MVGAAPVNFKRPLEVQVMLVVVAIDHAAPVAVIVQSPLPIVSVCAVELFEEKLAMVTL